jgi:hypothetical protein
MASTWSVADIISDIAVQSNSPPFASNTRITLAQATYWTAQSARSLSALLRQKFPEDREFLQYAEVSTIPSFPLISLPPDCGEVHSVVWLRSASEAELLQSAGAEHTILQPLETGTGWANTAETGYDVPRWRLEGQTIGFYPASGIGESLQVFYTTHLSPTSGTFQARLDFDRWVVLDVCIKIATAKKKPQDVQTFQQQKALLENDLLSRARKRDVAESHVMRDVRATRAMADYRRRWP